MVRPTKGRLKSINLMDFELLPHGYSRSAFLFSLYVEGAILIAVSVVKLAHEIGEGLRFGVVIFLVVPAAAIEKDVPFPRMAVHIDIHRNFPVPALFEHEMLKGVDFGVVLLAGLLPFAVQIHS